VQGVAAESLIVRPAALLVTEAAGLLYNDPAHKLILGGLQKTP